MIGRVMVLLRYRGSDLGPLLDEALAVLAAGDGFDGGWVARSPDDPEMWVLGTRWCDAGALRRGLGAYSAKLVLGPLQSFGTGDDSVLEILTEHDGISARTLTSDLAPDAGTAGPRAAGQV